MLLSIAYLSLAAILLSQIAQRLSLPSLVGMILAGVVVGPFGLDLLSSELLAISPEIRRVALVIILMRAGLALDVESLRKAGRPALLLCFLPACIEIVAMIFIAPPLLGISTLDAAILGSVIAAVSPAVVVPKMLTLIDERRGTDKSIPQMMMAGCSVDDLFVILLFTSFTTIAAGGEFHPSILGEVPVAIAMGIITGVAVGFVMVAIFRFVKLRDTLKIIVLLSVAFGLLSLEEALRSILPLSSLLAVMAMGATLLSRYPVLAKRLSPKYSKLWVIAEILLFTLVGASLDISYVAEVGPMAILVLLGALVWRMVGVYLSMVGSPLNTRERLFCMVAYIPKATVQAAIGAIPLSMGLGCGEIVLAMSILAILVTAPLGAFGIDYLSRFLSRE
ncbi:MAG: cation:proton antiporter [Rikenellaceae bacterium]